MKIAYPPYKEPYVYLGKDDAFVSLSWYDRSKKEYVREKIRLGIKGLSTKRKEKLLNSLCGKFKIVADLRNKTGIFHDETIIDNDEIRYDDIPILKALDQFIADENNPDWQIKQAISIVSNLKLFVKSNPLLLTLSFSLISETLIKKYVQFLYGKNLVGKTINNHLFIIGKLKEKIEKTTKTQINFAIERVKQVRNESEIYVPFSEKEKELIFGYFKLRDPHYYIFLLFQYYTCIRPGESVRLLVENVNLTDKTIFVPFYKSKNGLSNYIQILDPLYKILKSMDLEKEEGVDFLFSKSFKPGNIKKPSGKLSQLFRIACKELGIEDRQMYALKHTFNKDYVENNKKNIDWEWLRRHNRHATIQQTQQYISGLTAYFLDENNNTILDHT